MNAASRSPQWLQQQMQQAMTAVQHADSCRCAVCSYAVTTAIPAAVSK